MENTAEQATKQTPEQVIENWWTHYTAEANEGEPSRKGELAILRRCKTIEEIFFTPQYQNLYRQVAAAGWHNKIALAALAGVLAHVKKPEKPLKEKTVAAHFATPSKEGEEQPRVSESRFMRLVKIKTYPELYGALIRLVHLAGDSVPTPDLIKSIYWWDDQKRRDWTFNYYNALPDKKSKS